MLILCFLWECVNSHPPLSKPVQPKECFRTGRKRRADVENLCFRANFNLECERSSKSWKGGTSSLVSYIPGEIPLQNGGGCGEQKQLLKLLVVKVAKSADIHSFPDLSVPLMTQFVLHMAHSPEVTGFPRPTETGPLILLPDSCQTKPNLLVQSLSTVLEDSVKMFAPFLSPEKSQQKSTSKEQETVHSPILFAKFTVSVTFVQWRVPGCKSFSEKVPEKGHATSFLWCF